MIEALIAQLAQAADSFPKENTPSTLPAETVQMLARNTVAVKTEVPDKLDEWREQLNNIRADFANRGPDWAIEVTFVEALLAVLDDQPVSLPDNNPYAPVVQQVVAAINAH